MARRHTAHRPDHGERGYVMVALLVALSVMSIMMSVALPAWNTRAKREKEAELIFRGLQYARAIGAYQRKYGNAYPANVDVLVTEKFLRKKFLDPITNDAFDLVGPGTAIEGSSTPTAAVGAYTWLKILTVLASPPNATFPTTWTPWARSALLIFSRP